MSSHEIFVKNKFREVGRLVNKNSKVLDLGCNDGEVRHSLINPDYYGADLDRGLVNMLRGLNIPAEQLDLNKDSIPFSQEKFDYILLLDILEHVVDPRKILLDAKSRLSPNGKLVVSLPNDYHILNKIRFIFNKHLTEDPFHPFGHLHYFPIKSGEIFLKKAGFRVLKRVKMPPTKPLFLPQSLKNFLGNNFQQSFARVIIYLLEPINAHQDSSTIS